MSELVANAALDALGRLPSWLIWGYFWSKVLEPRGIKAYWFAWMALYAVQSVSMPFAAGPTVWGIALTVFQMGLFPLLMTRDGFWYKLLVIVATAAGGIAVELVMQIAVFLLGIDVVDYRQVLDHPFEYYALQLIGAFVYAVLFHLLYVLISGMSHRTDPVVRKFGLGMLSQLGVTCGMAALPRYFSDDGGLLLPMCCAYAAVNIAADALILVSVSRASAACEQRAHAEALRSLLDKDLARFGELADEVQGVARLRHDLRDELQSAAELVRRGDYVRAAALVDELERRVGNCSGSESPAQGEAPR